MDELAAYSTFGATFEQTELLVANNAFSHCIPFSVGASFARIAGYQDGIDPRPPQRGHVFPSLLPFP
jgi:hypothetical protein